MGFTDVDSDLVAILGFILAVILAGQSPALLAVFGGFLFVGWLLVQIGVFDEDSERDTDRSVDDSLQQDPLETLQLRYANGEIDEAEFEHRLDRIMESSEAVAQGRRGQRPSSGSNAVTRSSTADDDRSDRTVDRDREFDLEQE
ncbi:SHOCT domain-containing protein [Natronoglomus mannanivorans]|uniref:SHOCT domain-containing protein n=1 Tax=Natronoglomus mannanivorans TaxID=2979990 RepID=A0AAP2Z1P1_9EURY|nr:SHOCT domain-containing protein [Halobacteria archaeon AArc-xg1-1]